MSESYLLAGKRTPIGKLLGGLSSIPAPQLGASVIRETLRQSGVAPEQVDEVIMGNVLTAGVGQAAARQSALAAGLPANIPALTINKMCGSGLKAVMLADQAIRSGDAQIVVAGGMENMSRAPFLLTGARAGWKFGHQQTIDSMLHDGLWCAIENVGMGSLADAIAEKYQISRADQDAFAAESHRRAVEAIAGGKFDDQLVPIPITSRKGEILVDRDEGPRQETSFERLQKIRPAFSDSGSVTPGNASQISDGAAAVVVVSQTIANSNSAPIEARIVASASCSEEPKDLFIAPVGAMERALGKAGLSVGDIDLFELNEAFASQSLACMRALDLPADKVNVHGGAIALGHPIGASGARVLVTLLYALAEKGLRLGMVSLCLGGGGAVAMIIETQ